jgi:hypothetical protein
MIDETWSKFETDYLMELAQDYQLNWIVMADRYTYGDVENPKRRSIEVLTTLIVLYPVFSIVIA